MIVETIFLSIINQIKFNLVQIYKKVIHKIRSWKIIYSIISATQRKRWKESRHIRQFIFNGQIVNTIKHAALYSSTGNKNTFVRRFPFWFVSDKQISASFFSTYLSAKLIFFLWERTIRPLDPQKMYASKVFVSILQARYWFALFRQPIASMYNKNKHLG